MTWHYVTSMKHIPNFITSLNLAAGFTAVIFASNGDLTLASWLIVTAMVFDFLDGFAARLLKAYSETGKELDSLADVVSFGVAPAIIIYRLLVPMLDEPEVILAFITILMPVCAALRLAKFNIDPTQSTSFKGLPTPANAMAVISLVIAARYSSVPLVNSFISSPAALIVYSIVLSILMVTRIPLLSLKFRNLKFKGNEGRYILILFILITFIIFGFAAALMIIPGYIIISLVTNYLPPHPPRGA